MAAASAGPRFPALDFAAGRKLAGIDDLPSNRWRGPYSNPCATGGTTANGPSAPPSRREDGEKMEEADAGAPGTRIRRRAT